MSDIPLPSRALFLFFLLVTSCFPAPAKPAQAFKIFVNESGSGLVRVSRSELNLDDASFARLRLTHKGSEIPLQFAGKDADAAILFYASPDASIYSPTDVYWLAVADTPGLRIQTRTVEPLLEGNAPETFTATFKINEERLYIANAPGNSHWFYDSLTAPVTKTITANLIGFKPGAAQIQITMAGATDGEHQVRILVNDILSGEAKWNGQISQTYQVQSSNLRAGENKITLAAPGAQDRVQVDYIGSMTIHYPREFIAVNDALEFEGDAQNYRVRGFRTDAPTLYDVTDPLAVQKIEGFNAVRQGNATTLSFRDNLAKRRYLVAGAVAMKKPVAIRSVQPNDLKSSPRADYVIIAPANFRDALAPLLKYRAERGLTTQFVDIEQIYDVFGDGIPDPHALRDFLKHARENWTPPPRFVLLVGKASYDYRDNLKGPNKSLVPAFLVSTPSLGQAASDDWYVALKDDARPTLAIGRIPAKTPEQVSIAVSKIIAYESLSASAEWRRRAVFVADDKEASFNTSSNALVGNLPPGFDARKIYLSAYRGDLKPAREEIIREWNTGALLMTYIGHGSIDTWAEGPLFSSENSSALKNGERLPILLTPTCLDGFFYHPQKDSLAEELLFQKGGGIVAGLVPTGLSLPASQDVLMTALFAELFKQPAPTLGEAILRAKRKIVIDSEHTREVLQTFVLLGDPALKWDVSK